ncbi:hypothetical protein PMAYCL1PPCAC_32763, partial [Pristionchus mayeri]
LWWYRCRTQSCQRNPIKSQLTASEEPMYAVIFRNNPVDDEMDVQTVKRRDRECEGDTGDKYAREDAARRVLLGPLSVVIKCLGFDLTFSLFTKETRSRWISWIVTPLAILGLTTLFSNLFLLKKSEINGFRTLSWEWGETFLLFFLALNSLASALLIMRRTSTLFFLEFYETWGECAKLAGEKDSNAKEKADAESGKKSSTIPRCSVTRPTFVALAFLVFTGASISTSVKYAFNHGNFKDSTQRRNTSHFFDDYVIIEPLLSFWAALVTAAALSVYGVMHGILQDTIDDFNHDLKAASKAKQLSTCVDSFSVRYQKILILASTLSKRMGSYASFAGVAVAVV